MLLMYSAVAAPAPYVAVYAQRPVLRCVEKSGLVKTKSDKNIWHIVKFRVGDIRHMLKI
jgi:hypothetical protein